MVWAQPVQLTSVLEARLNYLSGHLVIHQYLDWCWVQKSKVYLHFFCSCSNETVCSGGWKWRNFMLHLYWDLSELESCFQKFLLNIIFTVYQIQFCVRLKLVCHRSILERKFHTFHEYNKCKKLSFAMKSAYKIVSEDHREISMLLTCHKRFGFLSRVLP